MVKISMNKAVEIIELDYTYPDKTKALDGINLEIQSGESIALVGANGAGKSTLLLHLNGINKGNKGQINIQGLPVEEKNIKKIRGLVGMVFQNPDDQLFLPTVFDDVSFGPMNMGLDKEEIKTRTQKALEAVGMGGFEKRLSHHLSFGQKKRIAIATVLSMGPEILVLDEPTSNLDPRNRRNLVELLKTFRTTKIIATHDMGMVANVCDRVVVMSQGKIVADGTTKEILTDEQLLDKYGLESPLLHPHVCCHHG